MHYRNEQLHVTSPPANMQSFWNTAVYPMSDLFPNPEKRAYSVDLNASEWTLCPILGFCGVYGCLARRWAACSDICHPYEGMWEGDTLQSRPRALNPSWVCHTSKFEIQSSRLRGKICIIVNSKMKTKEFPWMEMEIVASIAILR